MVDYVLSDEGDALRGADQCFQGGPLGLQLPLLVLVLTFGDFLEVAVNLGQLGVLEAQLGHAALVVDWYRGAVGHGLLDVVDADVVTEDPAGIGVGLLDGGAGEADEGGVRQGIAHVASEAVDEVVLATVSFVCDDHDVPAVGEGRHALAFLLGHELLDGREDDASAADLEEVA